MAYSRRRRRLFLRVVFASRQVVDGDRNPPLDQFLLNDLLYFRPIAARQAAPDPGHVDRRPLLRSEFRDPGQALADCIVAHKRNTTRSPNASLADKIGNLKRRLDENELDLPQLEGNLLAAPVPLPATLFKSWPSF